ncbi:MAG: hypothetical protein ABIO58_02815 [Luteimonas sp.]
MDATRHSHPVSPRRRRRWLIVLAICVVLAGIYAGALTWVTQRLETDIQKSIRPLPAMVEDHQHSSD